MGTVIVAIVVLVCHVIWQDTKFGGHRHSGSGDVIVFVYHVILQDHLIKALCDFMVWSPSRQVTTLPSLGPIGTVVVEIL